MHRKIYQIAWLLSLFVGISLACQLVTGVQEDIGNARGTAGAVSTDAKGFLNQLEGAATHIEESGVLGTARALATQEGPALIETAKALATQADEKGWKETAQAFATDKGPELLETGQALSTYAPESVLETVQAMATQVFGGGIRPEDIPLLPKNDILTITENKNTVTFTTSLDFHSVVEFYQKEMLLEGWQAVPSGSLVTGNAAMLQFEKADQAATVTILSASPQTATSVLVNVRNQ